MKLSWPENKRCPHCGNENLSETGTVQQGPQDGASIYRCKDCSKSNIIFED